MDIKELQDYRLSDAIKFHTHLNPRIWGPDEHLLPEVRQKLMAISEDFKEFLGLDLEVKDITISGSNAAYTYTDHSDIDLHLVADLPKADASEIYRELFDAKKYQYNDQHNFKIGGYDVELYVQNANEDPKSQGIYSVLDNKWISVPKRRKPEVDDISVKSKYEDLGKRIEAAIESGNAEQLEALGKKVREFRQAGLDKTGEFGPENLAFKILRSNGTLDQLRAARLAAKDRELSIEEAKKKKKKKAFRYGFGGYYFPGYHYYGQTDAAADGGGDGGGESVAESRDDLATTIKKFARYCGQELGIKKMPRIRLKKDPEWSRRNATFGRYIPDENTLILSVADRHLMDIMRTLAHELVHRSQDEQEPMPVHAGDTGSEWENEANAQAGVLMRGYGEANPGLFDVQIQKEEENEPGGEEEVKMPGTPLPYPAGTIKVDVSDTLDWYEIGQNISDLDDADPEKFNQGPPHTVLVFPNEPEEERFVKNINKLGLKTHDVNYPRSAVKEASGYIPVDDKEARDPRYSMALTVDIKPGENQRQAAKMGWKTDRAGTPPTARTNGLIEALTKKLQLVKEGLGFPLVSEEEDLEEVTMSPSALRAFANSPAAAGMQAGFEAELIFSGLGEAEDGEPDWEPDYDYDPRPGNIEEIIDFFQSGDFADLSNAQANRLRSEMQEQFSEWLTEKMGDDWSEDREDYILKWIKENEEDLSQEEMEEMRDKAIADYTDTYYSALDEYSDEWYSSTSLDESDWLRDAGIRHMTDASNEYDLNWPNYTDNNEGNYNEGGFSEENAQRLADSLSETLGVKTTVSSGYHGAKRDTSTWIFEPDGSLDGDEANDMPVEIVSPPMPLAQALEIMPKFFAWAEENGAYANKSTGFHMSVSMGDHESNVLDYTKLALFLGDEYVLEQFGRSANTYAKSAISKIKERKGKANAEEILGAMRKHLNHFASRALALPSGFGKYTSINPKNNYIEFRSAGGSDYFRDIDKIQNTLMRYARATDLAMDPDADKAEYAKKLYKLLTDTKTQQVTDPKTGTKRTEVLPSKDGDAISIFSRYVAGELPKSELKSFLKVLQYGREVAKNPPAEKILWQVTHPEGTFGIRVSASSAAEAIALAKKEYNDTMNPDDAYRAEPVYQTPQTDQLTAPAPDRPDGNYVLRRRDPLGSEPVGPVLYRFMAQNNSEAIEAARRWTTARGLDRRSVWLSSVDDVPPELLRPAAPGFDADAFGAAADRADAQARNRAQSQVPDVPIDVAQNFSPVQTEPQNFPAAGNEFSGEWKVVDGLGREVHRFGGIGNSQSDANRVAREWARRTGFDGNLEVYPVMR